MKRLKLEPHEKKLKKGEGKADFGKLLDEYTKKRKEVESDILGEQRIMEDELKKRLEEKRRLRMLDINDDK
jgi:hypothetical protein